MSFFENVDFVTSAHDWETAIQDKIKEAAYLKWLQAGMPEGKDVEFWLESESEFRSNYLQLVEIG